MMIHFKHTEHPLIMYEIDHDQKTRCRCKLCHRLIGIQSSTAYRCPEKQCEFYLHKYCAELAEKIQDPRHPDHPLFLSIYQYSPCAGCSRHRKNLAFCYYCKECNFTLDVECAHSDPKPIVSFQFHGHQLILSSQPSDSSLRCCVCKGGLDDFAVFKCGEHDECELIIHFRCAPFKFPETIKHEHYGVHTLNLSLSYVEDYTGEHYCDVCEGRRKPGHPVYRCENSTDSAYYVAHVCCALSPEIMQKLADGYESTLEARPTHIMHHRHHLIHLQESRIGLECSACEKPLGFRGKFVYACKECNLFLHQSCREIETEMKCTKIHPHHELILLYENSAKGSSFECRVCNELRCRFIYRCHSCSFNLCLRCYFGILVRWNLIHYEDYEHPMHRLFLFKKGYIRGRCSRCRCEWDVPTFKCIEQGCDYKVHLDCAPFSFPKTFNCSRHKCHPLQIFAKQKEGVDRDLSFPVKICGRCRKEIELQHVNFYWCPECLVAVHISCDIIQFVGEIPGLIADYNKSQMKEKMASLNTEITRLEGQEEKLKEEWMTNSKRMGALKLKCAQLMEAEVLGTSDDTYPREKRIVEINTKAAKLLAWKEEIRGLLRTLPKNSEAPKLRM